MDTYLTAKTYLSAETSPEQLWLPSARDGERWALEEFYRSYSSQIYSLCYRIVGGQDDAEDAMQAAFVQAFKELPRFRGDCMARSWLYRIATNESINLIRKRTKCDSSGTEYTDDLASVPDSAGAVQLKLAVRSSLVNLKPEHRVILVLRYWEQLNYEEIASVLAVSLPCVKMRLSRARIEFRRLYGDEI